MAFFLTEKLKKYRDDTLTEFYTHILPLLETDEVQQLEHYIQHNCFTRLNHCLDVAYYSFCIAKLLHWDAKSAARGGLLHDLFFYDRKEDPDANKRHMRNHPVVALENARQICALNKVEENIIRRHMWLATLVPPRYKEGYIVTFVDKFCAVKEGLTGLFFRRTLALAR